MVVLIMLASDNVFTDLFEIVPSDTVEGFGDRILAIATLSHSVDWLRYVIRFRRGLFA